MRKIIGHEREQKQKKKKMEKNEQMNNKEPAIAILR